MHYSLIPLLIGAISIPAVVVSGRGGVCRIAPPSPSPACLHAADPDGAMGLCPDLANHGWCDCGSAGHFPNLEEGPDICSYTFLNPSATIVLSTTNCIATPTVQSNNVTANITPAPAGKRAEPHLRSSNLRRRADCLNRRQHLDDGQIDCSLGKDNADSGSPIVERVPQQDVDFTNVNWPDFTDVDWPVCRFNMPSSSDVPAS